MQESLKLPSREEREQIKIQAQKWILEESAKTGSIWGSGATILSILLHNGFGPKNIVHNYNRIPIAYKVLVPVLITTAAFFTRSEFAVAEAQRAFLLKYALNGETLASQEFVGINAYKRFSMFTSEGFKSFLMDNRYRIVGGMWAATVMGTLAYNFSRRDISFSQKLINARMTGQSAALAGVIGFGAASAVEKPSQQP